MCIWFVHLFIIDSLQFLTKMKLDSLSRAYTLKSVVKTEQKIEVEDDDREKQPIASIQALQIHEA